MNISDDNPNISDTPKYDKDDSLILKDIFETEVGGKESQPEPNEEYHKSQIIDNIIEKSCQELNNIMDNWCKSHEQEFHGGKMRGDRGEHVEHFVKSVIHMFMIDYGINVRAVKGSEDKKELKIPNTEIKKYHQVDIHVYKNECFIAVIECKSYLDSCYYTRACDDFRLFKKFGYDVKKYVFTLENSMKEETKLFIDYETDNICDDIFYMLDGKRTSMKPIYDRKHRKEINKERMIYFIKTIYTLLIDELM